MGSIFNFRAFKVGGLTFVRLGIFSMSFCITRKPFHAVEG